MLANGACQLCPNVPVCEICDETGCIQCAYGYYAANGTCHGCQAFCS